MKKLWLCGLFVLLMICIVPVHAHTAVYDSTNYLNARLDADLLNRFNVLKNDIPYPDSSVKLIEIIEPPKHGSVYCFSDGWCDYVAEDLTYFGYDTFKYRTFDGNSYSNGAFVMIKYVSYFKNDLTSVHLYTPKDTKLAVDDLADYGIPEGIKLSWLTRPVSNPTHGKLSMRPCPPPTWSDGGCFDYMPDPGFEGWDKFIIVPWVDTGAFGDVAGNKIIINVYVGPEPYPAPEFPSSFIPVALIIGLLGTVLYIQRTKEN